MIDKEFLQLMLIWSVPLIFLVLLISLKLSFENQKGFPTVGASRISRVLTPQKYALPKNRNIYLRENHGKWSYYLLLSQDGSYRKILTQPAGSRDIDFGKWDQNHEGKLTLVSEKKVRDHWLGTDSLNIVLRKEEGVEELKSLRKSIERILEQYPNKKKLSFKKFNRHVSFVPDSVLFHMMDLKKTKNLSPQKIQEQYEAINKYSVVCTYTKDNKTITRKSWENIKDEIDRYLGEQKIKEFAFQVIRYKDFIFLVHANSFGASAMHVRQTIDSGKQAGFLAVIRKEKFQEETKNPLQTLLPNGNAHSSPF
jgi:hypothetical protein